METIDDLFPCSHCAATKALAQTTHDMLAASIKVAQNPQDMTTTQTFEASTKDVVNSLLELKKVWQSKWTELLVHVFFVSEFFSFCFDAIPDLIFSERICSHPQLTNGLDSGLKECAKAVNKIQTETSYILNDPRFQNDPNAYASLIDTSPQRRAQSAV